MIYLTFTEEEGIADEHFRKYYSNSPHINRFRIVYFSQKNLGCTVENRSNLFGAISKGSIINYDIFKTTGKH
jgi:hypothetical protein